MRHSLYRLVLAAVLVSLAGAAQAFGQGATTSSINGAVTDAGGGVIPGATVTAKNNANGRVFAATTNSQGAFTIPAVDAGTYTVRFTMREDGSAVDAIILQLNSLAAPASPGPSRCRTTVSTPEVIF